MQPENRLRLLGGAARYGIELDNKAVELFGRYLDLLADWGGRMNLTGIKGEREQVEVLLVDSLKAAGYLKETVADRLFGLRVMDFGSGAGIPGIPMKIALPMIDMTLSESKQKKAGFLEAAVRELGLPGLRVFAGRAEDLAGKGSKKVKTFPGFEVIVCRAVAEISGLLKSCHKLLSPSGVLIAMKGPDPSPELDEAGKVMDRLGFTLKSLEFYSIPGDFGVKSLVIITKK